MGEFRRLILLEIVAILVACIVYFMYTMHVADDFSLRGKTATDTAQNSLYLAMCVATGMGSRQFEPSTAVSRGVSALHLLAHFMLLRAAIVTAT